MSGSNALPEIEILVYVDSTGSTEAAVVLPYTLSSNTTLNTLRRELRKAAGGLSGDFLQASDCSCFTAPFPVEGRRARVLENRICDSSRLIWSITLIRFNSWFNLTKCRSLTWSKERKLEEVEDQPEDNREQKRARPGIGDDQTIYNRSLQLVRRAMLNHRRNCPGYIGRPDYTTSGPPISIFHPAFEEFKDELEQDIEPSPEFIELAHDFIVASLQIYPDEASRAEAVEPILGQLLDRGITPVLHHDKSAGDGSVIVEIHFKGAPVPLKILIFEFINEFGSGVGDPTVQAGLTARKVWAQTKLDSVRDRRCCPVFLVTVPGPYVIISGSVFAERFILEPLIPIVYSSPKEPSTLYYMETVPTLRRPTSDHGAPNVPEAKQLMLTMHVFPDNPWCAIFWGSIGVQDVVFVKFVPTYGEDAHRYMAEHGLAPNLRFCMRIPGGLIMVMDYIEGVIVLHEFSGAVPPYIVQRIDWGIDVLHKDGFVFGDLRKANIMIPTNDQCKIMFVDFDWSRKEGQVRYPL
ncbi:hypothetical protein GYMLUDRAFT_57130 [Collybiopsis luxurians FD-317 M1]|uniref:Uncharacterized protein n=1 Tax=Collybiopsis luxurians FD-317 M1 TaxID=944289 RepID=A0A0D0C7G4_9AGAR|nr:hypothetical protein GYMLUDRAFT_57130 [Collybiopsis luxurians FD-317 M1]